MSQRRIRAEAGDIARMSERQLRLYSSICHMLDSFEVTFLDSERSRAYVEEDSGRLVIELTHRFDNRLSFAVTLQEHHSHRICVWYDGDSVDFFPEWHETPDGWIEEALRLVWHTVRGSITVEVHRHKGEVIARKVLRNDAGVRRGLVSEITRPRRMRWYQRPEVEEIRMGFNSWDMWQSEPTVWLEVLIDAVRAMAAEPDEQIKSLRGREPAQLGFDMEDAFELVDKLRQAGIQLSDEVVQLLRDINHGFDQMGQNHNTELWSRDALRGSDRWLHLRQLALQALAFLQLEEDE